MPLYEYQCDACGHRFEVIRKFSDPPVETCPKCGGHVQKLIAAPAFQFKGSGWYITDYAKKDSPASSAKTEKTEKSEKTEKTETKKSEGTSEGTKPDAAPAKTDTKNST